MSNLESNQTEARDLTGKLLQEVSYGKKVLIWGSNSVCDMIVQELASRGWLEAIQGIIDDKASGGRIHGLEIASPGDFSKFEFDALVITDNTNKEQVLREFSRLDARRPKVIITGTRHLDFSDQMFQEILSSCTIPSKAGGYQNMLVHIYQSLVYLVNRGAHGAVTEFGVYQGGTTAFIAKTLRRLGSSAKVYGFDTFAGFPARKSILDQFQDPKYEFRNFEAVRNYLEPLGVELVKGDISDTYRKIKGIPLIFSFFDTDNYTPTHDALGLCYEQTVPGGILAFDHFFCDERWLDTIGERMAVEEILSGKRVFNLYGSGIFIKY